MIRRICAAVLAGTVFAVTLVVAFQRSRADRKMVFFDSPRELLSAGHWRQVEMVRHAVPRGATILYLMDKEEAWQLGLWKRSLYPDYEVKEVTGTAQLESPAIREIRARKRVEYVISAGAPPIDPGFVWQMRLPDYPNGIAITLGRLPVE